MKNNDDFFGRLLGWFGKRKRKKQGAAKRRPTRSMHIEPLEKRQLLTVLYWDQGGTPSAAGSGTWYSASGGWSHYSDGSDPCSWANGDSAVFMGAGGTITLYASPIYAASITFETSGYQISSNNLCLPSGGTTIDVHCGATATINSTIAGCGALTSTGSGMLTLNGDNSYSGGTFISGGYVQVGSSTAS